LAAPSLCLNDENFDILSFLMWPNEKQRQDTTGKCWNFHYQYFGKEFGQRLFFWDEEFAECGVLLFTAGKMKPYSAIQNLIDKLVADSALRKKYARELRHPYKRYYAEFGAFPEETR
jgi:hypothetical protein